jgi:glycosyltransferase involved in cell wall biosynthesis
VTTQQQVSSEDEAHGGSARAPAVRVLRLFSRLNVGGPSLHVVHLTVGLRAFGFETLLAVGREGPREGNLLSWAQSRGVECRQIAGLGREIRPVSDSRSLIEVYRLMRRFRPAIVHTHTAKAGLLGRVAARVAGVPIRVHTFHGHVLRGYFGPLRTHAFRRLEARLALSTQMLVAVSEAVKRDLVELGVAGPERIRVIPLGLDLEPLARSPLPRGALRGPGRVAEGAPLIGCVGRLAPIKDLGTLLEAVARVHRVRPDVRVALVGDGEERALLEARCEGLGLSGVVCFHGWKHEMEQVYGDLDVVVNSSRNEGTPVALIEALAAGRPVVATRVGGTPDLLADGRHGLLVPPGDPEALAQALLRVLAEPGEAAARARAGREYVLARHTTARLLRDVDRLYRELLDAARMQAA